MDIGECIAIARKAAGLTQAQLAEKSGVAAITIHQYEHGKRQPRLDMLGKIARALNTSVYETVGSDWSGIDMSDAFGRDQSTSTQSIPPRARLDAAYAQLNVPGQEKAADAVETIAGNPKYQRQDPDPTPEEDPPKGQ